MVDIDTKKIMTLLADERIREILKVTHIRPKKMDEIVKKTGIPVATAHRLVKKLLDAGLIQKTVHEKFSTDREGYRSTVKRFHFELEDGQCSFGMITRVPQGC